MSAGEYEIKLHIPAGRLAGVQAAMARAPVHTERLRARYFDTAEGLLARHGIVLRLRREGDAAFQTAKAPGEGSLHRLEHNAPVDRGATRPVIARHAGTAVGRRLVQALEGVPTPAAALREVFRTDIVRTTRSVTSGGTEIELALDVGRIIAGKRHIAVAELELELRSGDRYAVLDLAREWCESHGLWLDLVSKSMRGLRLASRQEVPEAAGYLAASLRPKMQTGVLARAVAASALDQVLANASEIAAGRYADEHVHQARIGLRRLRSVLNAFADIAPLATAQDLDQLGSTSRALGRERDASHVLPALLQQMTEGDAGPPLRLPAADGLPSAAEAVRDIGFQCALLRLLAQVESEPGTRAVSGPRAREGAAVRLEHLQRQVSHSARRFEDLTMESRHQLRKRVKSLRYLAEAVGPLFRGKEVARFVQAIKPLQDALGELQDAATGQDFWTRGTAEDPNCWYAVGWLQARQQALRAECSLACKAFRKEARPFWA